MAEKKSKTGTAMKLLMAAEITATIFLVTLAARAQEQEWRYQAKKLKSE
jgi:hypothetical protein